MRARRFEPRRFEPRRFEPRRACEKRSWVPPSANQCVVTLPCSAFGVPAQNEATPCGGGGGEVRAHRNATQPAPLTRATAHLLSREGDEAHRLQGGPRDGQPARPRRRVARVGNLCGNRSRVPVREDPGVVARGGDADAEAVVQPRRRRGAGPLRRDLAREELDPEILGLARPGVAKQVAAPRLVHDGKRRRAPEGDRPARVGARGVAVLADSLAKRLAARKLRRARRMGTHGGASELRALGSGPRTVTPGIPSAP